MSKLSNLGLVNMHLYIKPFITFTMFSKNKLLLVFLLLLLLCLQHDSAITVFLQMRRQYAARHKPPRAHRTCVRPLTGVLALMQPARRLLREPLATVDARVRPLAGMRAPVHHQTVRSLELLAACFAHVGGDAGVRAPVQLEVVSGGHATVAELRTKTKNSSRCPFDNKQRTLTSHANGRSPV